MVGHVKKNLIFEISEETKSQLLVDSPFIRQWFQQENRSPHASINGHHFQRAFISRLLLKRKLINMKKKTNKLINLPGSQRKITYMKILKNMN